MVEASSIIQANAQFAREQHAGVVCVFVGATSGIGAGTLEKMISMFQAPTFYVLGRSEKRFSTQLSKLQTSNPSAKVIFLECEFALLSDVDAVSKRITDSETKVDYLYMSPGLIPLNGAQCTPQPTPQRFTSPPLTIPQTPKKASKSASPSPTTPASASSQTSSRTSAPPPARAS